VTGPRPVRDGGGDWVTFREMHTFVGAQVDKISDAIAVLAKSIEGHNIYHRDRLDVTVQQGPRDRVALFMAVVSLLAFVVTFVVFILRTKSGM